MTITTIVAVRDGAATLGRQLDALARQETDWNHSVLVVNNRSSDETLAVAQDFSSRFPFIGFIDAPEARSRAEALNAGIESCVSTVLLTTDHDDLVSTSWVQSMARALEKLSIVSGSTALAREPLDEGQFMEPTFDVGPRYHGAYMPFALGCNMGFTRDLFTALSGFDPEFDKAEDIDFSWRAQLLGFPLGFAADARVLKSVRTNSKDRFRQHLGYGRADYALEKRYAAHGYNGTVPRAVKKLAWATARAPMAVWTPERRSDVAAVAGSGFGVLLGATRVLPWL